MGHVRLIFVGEPLRVAMARLWEEPMRVVLLASFVVAAFAFAAPVARAQEVKVEEKDVPKAVLEAVRKKYPKAKMTGFEKETDKKDKSKVTYEVDIEDGKRKIDIDLTPEGKILAEEETIDPEALPEKVKKGLAGSKYATWTVKSAERIVKEEKEDDPSYELVVTNGERKFEIVLDKEGKITKEEEKKVKKAEKDEKDDDD
jgi:hypothetical protein